MRAAAGPGEIVVDHAGALQNPLQRFIGAMNVGYCDDSFDIGEAPLRLSGRDVC